MKSGNMEPSKSTSWKVLETVMSHLKFSKIEGGSEPHDLRKILLASAEIACI